MYITPAERLIRALEDYLDIPVVTKVPSSRPDMFVRIDASSPRAVTPVSDDTLMAVQVYGVEQDRVIDSLGAIRFVLTDEIYARDQAIIWWSEEAGPHEYPDPDDGSIYRWQLTGVLTTTLT